MARHYRGSDPRASSYRSQGGSYGRGSGSSFESFNEGRAEFGRRAIARGTFDELENVGVHSSDIADWARMSTVLYAAKLAKAAEVADYWKSIAPVRGDKPTHGRDDGLTVSFPDPSKNDPGEYQASIRVHRENGVHVGSDLYPLCMWLEYGSVHNPEHGYGARVLENFGGGVPDEGARITKDLYLG